MCDEQKELLRQLQQQATETVENFTAPIDSIIETIIAHTSIEPGASRFGLTMDDLYAIAIRLPAECAYLQAQINTQMIRQKVESFLIDIQITESITLLQGTKGDAAERKRRAEAMAKDDVLTDIVTQQIISSLQAAVARADRVYEGVKKIIDAKMRESSFDRKPGYPVG